MSHRPDLQNIEDVEDYGLDGDEQVVVTVNAEFIFNLLVQNLDASAILGDSQAPHLYALSIMLKRVALRQLAENSILPDDLQRLTELYEAMASELVERMESGNLDDDANEDG